MTQEQDIRSQRFSQLVGLELKANFARCGIPQSKVAELLGHSKSGYSRWLNAKPSMPLEALLNTCELLKINPGKVVDSAYERLIAEMGEYKPPRSDQGREAKIQDMIMNPDKYDLAANRDKYKQAEKDIPLD